DVRVILIKTADRLQVMRNLSIYDKDAQHRLVSETSYLYAPLAHRLGLYSINSELQDLSLKFQNPAGYEYIINRLKETETERENFVAEFVKPLENKLQEKDFRFSMKARTKSIYSIWNKMQKKKVSFVEVMDLFAIRVILDSKPENEKTDCWMVYSLIPDQYQANPDRMRDWINIPKSNGYESLDDTVMGSQGGWMKLLRKVWPPTGSTKVEGHLRGSIPGWQVSGKYWRTRNLMSSILSTTLALIFIKMKSLPLHPKVI